MRLGWGVARDSLWEGCSWAEERGWFSHTPPGQRVGAPRATAGGCVVAWRPRASALPAPLGSVCGFGPPRRCAPPAAGQCVAGGGGAPPPVARADASRRPPWPRGRDYARALGGARLRLGGGATQQQRTAAGAGGGRRRRPRQAAARFPARRCPDCVKYSNNGAYTAPARVSPPLRPTESPTRMLQRDAGAWTVSSVEGGGRGTVERGVSRGHVGSRAPGCERRPAPAPPRPRHPPPPPAVQRQGPWPATPAASGPPRASLGTRSLAGAPSALPPPPPPLAPSRAGGYTSATPPSVVPGPTLERQPYLIAVADCPRRCCDAPPRSGAYPTPSLPACPSPPLCPPLPPPVSPLSQSASPPLRPLCVTLVTLHHHHLPPVSSISPLGADPLLTRSRLLPFCAVDVVPLFLDPPPPPPSATPTPSPPPPSISFFKDVQAPLVHLCVDRVAARRPPVPLPLTCCACAGRPSCLGLRTPSTGRPPPSARAAVRSRRHSSPAFPCSLVDRGQSRRSGRPPRVRRRRCASPLLRRRRPPLPLLPQCPR